MGAGAQVAAVVLAVAAWLGPAPAGRADPTGPADPGVGTPNLTAVASVRWAARHGKQGPAGTDLEFASVGGRDYVFAGTYRNGLQVTDVTDPARPRWVAAWDCGVGQGDVQVLRRGARTYLTYSADDIESETRTGSGCYRDLGRPPATPYGVFVVDVTDPRAPRTAGFAPIPAGSHNSTVHPGGRFLYSSDGDTGPIGGVDVVDLADPARPRPVGRLDLGPGMSAHDVSFAAGGARAYVAAGTQTVIADTTDPARPRVVGRLADPAITYHHQAEAVTLADPLLGRRTFLLVSDELAGAAPTGTCPGGGLHAFDITGARERAPVKVGFFAIGEVRPALPQGVCTAHVFQVHPTTRLLTIGWYAAGTRVVDLSGLAGVSVGLGGPGMREVAHRRFADSLTWAAKAGRTAPDGSVWLFAGDKARGLDVLLLRTRAP